MPEPPYALGSPQDLAEVAEVLDVALHRTPEQIAIVHKWADRSPPAIWSGLLNDRITSRNLSLRQAARAHAFLNAAIYDGFVACWSAKYLYWTARPFQRITGKQNPGPPMETSGQPSLPRVCRNSATPSEASMLRQLPSACLLSSENRVPEAPLQKVPFSLTTASGRPSPFRSRTSSMEAPLVFGSSVQITQRPFFCLAAPAALNTATRSTADNPAAACAWTGCGRATMAATARAANAE